MHKSVYVIVAIVPELVSLMEGREKLVVINNIYFNKYIYPSKTLSPFSLIDFLNRPLTSAGIKLCFLGFGLS